MSYTIDSKYAIKDLAGENIKDPENQDKLYTLGIFLSTFLMSAKQPLTGISAMKAWGWAQKFFKEEKVVLDVADFNSLKKALEGSVNSPMFALGQTLELFEELKSEPKK